MSVYVDPQMASLISTAWRWPTACHCWADSIPELHSFAAHIGLRQEWFQDGRFPHFDLNASRRRMAVKAGVVELDRRAAVQMWRAKGWTRRRPAKEVNENTALAAVPHPHADSPGVPNPSRIGTVPTPSTRAPPAVQAPRLVERIPLTGRGAAMPLVGSEVPSCP